MKNRIAANDVSFRQELYGQQKKGQQHYNLPMGHALAEGMHTASIPGQPGRRVSQSPGASRIIQAVIREDFNATGVLEDYSTYITEALADKSHAEVPESRIPTELHMYEGSVVAQLGDPDTEVLYNEYTNKFEKKIFPSMAPSGRVQVMLLARILDKMLKGIHRCETTQPDWDFPGAGGTSVSVMEYDADGAPISAEERLRAKARDACGDTDSLSSIEQELRVWDLVLSEVVS